MSGRKQRCVCCNRKFHDDELLGGMCPTCRRWAETATMTQKQIQHIEEEARIRYASPEERDDYVYFS